jgi:hypothetical protein
MGKAAGECKTAHKDFDGALDGGWFSREHGYPTRCEGQIKQLEPQPEGYGSAPCHRNDRGDLAKV